MKITRRILESQVERLNERLNRPKTAWTRLETPAPDGHNMRANIGNFSLDTHSPGDGWTRYKLTEIVSVGGGEMPTSNRSMTLQEMYAYLLGIHDALDTQYSHTFDAYSEVH